MTRNRNWPDVAGGIPLPPLPPGAVWHATGSNAFPYAARAEGRWWVLRLNGFPDHPLHTFFVDGRRVADIEDLPADWHRPGTPPRPVLTEAERAEVLRLMAGLGPYGSEAGTPCTGSYCTCEALADD
ncbi:hypothetical protein AB0D54_05680 [Streptomyces xanthophaeus]|uniref:hypothetical protein n=1 Tax=Streptomyces xanthophaeus TaxID=67385 RepID=UPI0034459383